MKIEKVNDHQIRCTLTREDLADRELKLSELAYGTEKAKDLFRDMMQQASFEFGFEADDIPLMIEAIPLSSECIVLIITKVEDPEELDTRFPSLPLPSMKMRMQQILQKLLLKAQMMCWICSAGYRESSQILPVKSHLLIPVRKSLSRIPAARSVPLRKLFRKNWLRIHPWS